MTFNNYVIIPTSVLFQETVLGLAGVMHRYSPKFGLTSDELVRTGTRSTLDSHNLSTYAVRQNPYSLELTRD